ncbi:MAG: 23S rRNA (adenine(2503)-C(2))-methyltransferase RlmN [Candidatus Omnitrophica bacterium]|nr:23S rRNA (adenine(2503)-C(2))-methyltransferase RlmN [Candidatus Omnitrophota bacterium]
MENIKNFTFNELQAKIMALGYDKYRVDQIFSWIYKKMVNSFTEIKNISKPLSVVLEKNFSLSSIKPVKTMEAKDKTKKTLFMLPDGKFIESVIIISEKRKTLCISTQAGCKQGCMFCASGKHGFKRDLETGEILDQVLYASREMQNTISNYVFMGMGEPLDNYDNVVKAIRIMNDRAGLDIGARKITLSTCGIAKKIEKLSNENIQINLSISLHAVTDKKRERLMPVNKKYPLKSLISAAKKYFEKTGRMITLEYTLIKGENDSMEDVIGLTQIAKTLKAKINLIAYMPVKGCSFEEPDKTDVQRFVRALEKENVKVTLRASKGKEINGACGQLAGKS